jgi:RimJ/RimL family protein N-acetyltransferase
LWDYLIDDSPLDKSKHTIRLSDNSRWYTAHVDGELAGAFWMRRENFATWEVHANILPEFWGKGQGTKICQVALDYMAEETDAIKLIAIVPTSAPQTMKMTEAVGFKREGIREKSWSKNGELYDQAYYGITRKL